LKWVLLTIDRRGIGVGSRLDFEELNKFLEEKNVRLDKVIDRVYSFDDAPAAFERLISGAHTGKVVIKLDHCVPRKS